MFRYRFIVALFVLGASACTPEPQAVTITFQGQVGDQAFNCGQTYAGLGKTATQIQPSDFRLYIHNVRLIDATHAEQALSLDQDMLWQYQNLALLDFENKSPPCDGTTATNTAVHGTALAGNGGYVGLRFVLGIPAELNHGNQATAPAPLNYSSLFWSWQGGYKFLRTEGQTVSSANTLMVHLGSTGCQNDSAGQTQCVNPNTVEVELTSFDPAKNQVAVDLAALLAGSDLSTDMICMSTPSAPECGPIFQRLGLPQGGIAASQQAFFRVK